MITTSTENFSYLVRWNTPHRPNVYNTQQQLFSHEYLLTARRQAFRFAEDLCQNRTGKYTLDLEIYLVQLLMEGEEPQLKTNLIPVFQQRYPICSFDEEPDDSSVLTEPALLKALNSLNGEYLSYEQCDQPTGSGCFRLEVRYPLWLTRCSIIILFDALAYATALIGRYNRIQFGEEGSGLTFTIIQLD